MLELGIDRGTRVEPAGQVGPSADRIASPAPSASAVAAVLPGLISFAGCTLTTLGFLYACEPCHHWFVIPITLCGILIGVDAARWLLGQTNLYDPAGILGAMGVHFFFLAPLLHVAWDSWMDEVPPPPDWREWLGYMAILNFWGLVVYRLVRRWVEQLPARSRHVTWSLNERRFLGLAACMLVVSAATQAWVYASFGGIVGYIEAATDLIDRERMQGYGAAFMISETFPIVAMMAYAVWARRNKTGTSWAALTFVLVAFFVVKMLFGGLRGSRSTTVWGLFWALGIIHLYLRPVPRHLVAVGIVGLIVFMYFYGLYKAAGMRALENIGDTEAQAAIAQKGKRSIDVLILGDLGRSDVQAFVLYRLCDPMCNFTYGWGRTYAATVASFIPRAFWPDRPHDVTQEGTEILYGRGSYVPTFWVASKVYGLAGEAMLNFGPAAAPFAFAGLGLAVGLLRRFMRTLRPGDARWLVFPFLVNFSFSILNSDSINLLFFLTKDGAVVFALLWLSTRRRVEGGIATQPDPPFPAGKC
jgi:hypothetical protein